MTPAAGDKHRHALMTEWSVIYKDRTLAVDHYENFPVASILLPARLRPAVEALYRWARTADDLADEGDAPPDARLAALDAMLADLDRIEAGHPPQAEVARALAPHLQAHALPIGELRRLLSAFAQDVMVTRYPDFAALRDYCSRSADPIGRLLLHLYGACSDSNRARSDAICTALQLINFWQDVALDWRKGRIYLPADSLERHGIGPADIAAWCDGAPVDDAWRALMRDEVARTQALLESGAPLARDLPGRIGWELRLVVEGGRRVLERIETADYDVFRHRPTLHLTDWSRMLVRAAFR